MIVGQAYFLCTSLMNNIVAVVHVTLFTVPTSIHHFVLNFYPGLQNRTSHGTCNTCRVVQLYGLGVRSFAEITDHLLVITSNSLREIVLNDKRAQAPRALYISSAGSPRRYRERLPLSQFAS